MKQYLTVGDKVAVRAEYLPDGKLPQDLRRSTGAVRGISRRGAMVELESGYTMRVSRDALTVTTAAPGSRS